MTASTYPTFQRRMTDFCCDYSGRGCGHHIDGHGGFGSGCTVSGCDCGVWRDHVNCNHRRPGDEAERLRAVMLDVSKRIHERSEACADTPDHLAMVEFARQLRAAVNG